jgi:hypothetical protein
MSTFVLAVCHRLAFGVRAETNRKERIEKLLVASIEMIDLATMRMFWAAAVITGGCQLLQAPKFATLIPAVVTIGSFGIRAALFRAPHKP